MKRCRVYLLTYQRNELLPRAIQSLLAQTFKDWICEVHNDCPINQFPEEYIKHLHDERFMIINHPTNLGGTRSFNKAFAGCQEEYISILEDDNWWEDFFLEEMIGLMDQKPTLKVAWSNMRIWKEDPENQWIDTGKTTWPVENDILFQWPHYKQALGALHSVGAMICRSANSSRYIIPDEVLLDAIELVRERAF
jgi:glycosyltransferase involved in cell wall biosynthesis